MANTTRGFFFGMKYEHGLDFAEYTGDWPLPEAGGGCLKIYDDNNQIRMLVLDYYDGCFYDVSLRDGPTSTYVTEGFRDKMATNGTGGTNIAPSVTFKEDTGEYEKFITEHHTSHFYIRPNKESNRDQSGYDSNGYPSGIVFSSTVYVDGNVNEQTATATDINRNNEIVYDRKVEGNRIQTKFSSDMSNFKLVGRQQFYITKDIVHTPSDRITYEGNLQDTINTNLSIWYTRGVTPLVCRISGIIVTSTGTVGYTVDGPDGKTNSAIGYNGTLTMTSVIPGTTGTIYLWSKSATTLTVGGASRTLTSVYTSGGWTLYRYSGTIDGIVRLTGSTSLYDFRMYSGAVTLPTYYREDVINNSANNVCPLF